MELPRAILGTMTFGKPVKAAEAERMVRTFLDAGGVEIDTARIYADGRTEEILGGILKSLERGAVRIATKAHPSRGGLGPDPVTTQLEESLRTLGTDYVDLFYLHQPDPDTPIERTLEACARLHEGGRFRELGLSNYPAWQVAGIDYLARREGWPVPVVYQGMYNALTRDVERELSPCLRALGMRFYAYNPLAAGLLTGRYRAGGVVANPPAEGRFKDFDFYVDRYWKSAYLDAAEMACAACDGAGLAPAAAALRWLARHSILKGERGDAVIVGASRLAHIEENLAACGGADLPPEVVRAFDEGWDLARPACPKYFRP